MSQTKPTSFRRIFEHLQTIDDELEKTVIESIKRDYERFHKHDFSRFNDLLLKERGNPICPRCHCSDYIKYGHGKNGVQRYRCRICDEAFNSVSSSLFFASKINLDAWFVFIECILNQTSVKAASMTAKISIPTGYYWLSKIFRAIRNYQETILLTGEVYFDETYISVNESIIARHEDGTEYKGLSRNKMCIAVGKDKISSFALICGRARPHRKAIYKICKEHISSDAIFISDDDNSHMMTIRKMKLTHEIYHSDTPEAYEKLEPIDQYCSRLKKFLRKHMGLRTNNLDDYLNLFVFIDNMKGESPDLYKATKELLSMLISVESTIKFRD